jgi:hypothetical protein
MTDRKALQKNVLITVVLMTKEEFSSGKRDLQLKAPPRKRKQKKKLGS